MIQEKTVKLLESQLDELQRTGAAPSGVLKFLEFQLELVRSGELSPRYLLAHSIGVSLGAMSAAQSSGFPKEKLAALIADCTSVGDLVSDRFAYVLFVNATGKLLEEILAHEALPVKTADDVLN